MTDQAIQLVPHVDPLALFDSIAATETSRVEADEARIAFENQACRELRDALFSALDVLLKSRKLHFRWHYSGNPPALFVCHTRLYIDDTRPHGDDLALRVTGDAQYKSGGLAIRAEFDKEKGKAHLVRVETGPHSSARRERFETWVAAYEFVVREIASAMAENKRRMSS